MNYNELTFIAKENNYTMSKLAEEIGFSRVWLKESIEKKTIPWAKMAILCEKLAISPNELMDWPVPTGGNYAAHIQGNNTQNSTEAITVLAQQLDKKDREINRLLTILEKFKLK